MAMFLAYTSDADQVNYTVNTTSARLGAKSDITTNATYYASTYGLDGFSSVTVAVPTGGGTTPTLVPLNVSTNGTYDPANYNADGFSSVSVSVSGGSGGGGESGSDSGLITVASGTATISQQNFPFDSNRGSYRIEVSVSFLETEYNYTNLKYSDFLFDFRSFYSTRGTANQVTIETGYNSSTKKVYVDISPINIESSDLTSYLQQFSLLMRIYYIRPDTSIL